MRFDVLIRGGEVVDPGGGYEGALDVAITRGRIADCWRSRFESALGAGHLRGFSSDKRGSYRLS